jgi:hypothetical protein
VLAISACANLYYRCVLFPDTNIPAFRNSPEIPRKIGKVILVTPGHCRKNMAAEGPQVGGRLFDTRPTYALRLVPLVWMSLRSLNGKKRDQSSRLAVVTKKHEPSLFIHAKGALGPWCGGEYCHVLVRPYPYPTPMEDLQRRMSTRSLYSLLDALKNNGCASSMAILFVRVRQCAISVRSWGQTNANVSCTERSMRS